MNLRFVLLGLLVAAPALAQNIVAPKKGIPIPADVRASLEKQIAVQRELSAAVREKFKGEKRNAYLISNRLPDAEVFYVSVARTLEDEIFYKKSEFDAAEKLLKEGEARLRQLLDRKTPWLEQTGLVIRGYRSEIDGSVQPYQMLVPEGYKPGDDRRRRLDIWYHGRNNNLSEVAFLSRNGIGVFAPDDAFVLAPYGRFCNAMKFAGETDTFEALNHARLSHPIDFDRISVRGFSMGGAATWHMGTHHASRWAAVNPGAGFVETKIYQNLADQLSDIPEYEQRLWRLYDSLEYAVNLENTTLVAYSGEIDKQKAAADLMEKALADHGVKMTHIIGPDTGHKYEPGAREQVAKLVNAAADRGRTAPDKIRFTTYTLKYNTMHWVTIDALQQHWQKAAVEAEFESGEIKATTAGVAAISFDRKNTTKITLDGQSFELPAASFVKEDGKWKVGEPTGLRKQHNLQGPIDDAFMNSFLFVGPSKVGWHAENDDWVKSELEDAVFQWRRQMRGKPRVKSADEADASDLGRGNVVLWGDPQSNPLMAEIIDDLPIQWTADEIVIGDQKFDSAKNMPALIYPYPGEPWRYVVLNSGPTFMQFGAQSNSQQTPKLPDYAILDTSVSVQKRIRGNGVRHAGFFGERWEVKK